MPTEKEVSVHVTNFVGIFANLNPSIIDSGYVLADPPLSIDSVGLGFMTVSIKSYIKSIKEDATISVSEVRKAGLTVQGLITLVYNKVRS